jgi:4a-hydroxytetrahydrobiopterin dehydratase
MQKIHWKEENNALHAELQFADFKQAFAFMVQVALLAEQLNHHPDWRNVYNRLEIKLSTHDAGNVITEQDRRMAEAISHLYAQWGKK